MQSNQFYSRLRSALTWLRNFLWPVYGDENKKFIPMLAMLGLTLFNYTSVRITKDSLILTALHSDAAVLNFLKSWIVFPASILFVIYYNAISDYVGKKRLFYFAIMPFIAFFSIFGLILYPLGWTHLDPNTLLSLQTDYPRFKYIFPVFTYWGYSLFYIFAELWGNVCITLLFWNFANLATSKSEVARFYPMFGVYSNIGLIIAGEAKAKGLNVQLTCYAVIVGAILIAFIYWILNSYVVEISEVIETKKKSKPGFKQSLQTILNSKYLLLIAILVLSYGITINLVEVSWKQKVKELYPSQEAYDIYMGNFFSWTGKITILVGLFTKGILRKFGWLTAALISPFVLVTSSIAFFSFSLFGILLPASLIASLLSIQIFVGAIQNIASKSTKYSLFDPTTQMAYIPLEDELRIKGKAAVDVIGGRLGKSLGGHIQTIALLVTGWSQNDIAGILFAALAGVSCLWIYATVALSKEYNAKLLENEIKTVTEQVKGEVNGK